MFFLNKFNFTFKKKKKKKRFGFVCRIRLCFNTLQTKTVTLKTNETKQNESTSRSNFFFFEGGNASQRDSLKTQGVTHESKTLF